MDPYKYFSQRRPDEEVVLLLRRHWHALLRHFLYFIAEIILPLIAFLVFIRFTNFALAKDNPVSILIILSASAYYLFIWLFFFNHWIDYYLDVWIVSNQRIINIEQKGLFSRTIAELNVERIQDVTSDVQGKLATVLDFGDVHIQTAGEEKRFIFEEVPKPRQVAAKIIELHQEAVKKAIAEGKMAPPASPEQKDSLSSQDKNEIKTF